MSEDVLAPAGQSEPAADVADFERAVVGVRAMVGLLEANGVSRLRLRWGTLDLELERAPAGGAVGAPQQTVGVTQGAGATAPAVAAAAAGDLGGSPAAATLAGAVAIRAPLVGVFYRSPTPQSPPFVELGQRIEPGQQVAIVEAMKMFNPIMADVAGVVVELPVATGDVVEFEQVLMMVQP